MRALWGPSWGPRPLPELVAAQLDSRGFSVEDAGRIARQINEGGASSEAASLFVDLGSCKFLEGDIDGAIAAWRHVISSSSDDPAAQALLNLGLLYEHLNLYDRALGLLGAAVDRNVEPHIVPAAMACARCQVARGDTEGAMETMARVAQLTMTHHPEGPELIETLYGLGDVAERAGRADRAERSWRVAAASPTSPLQQAAADRLATLLVELGHDDELEDLIEQQRDAPVDMAAAMRLDSAEALCRLDDMQGAVALLDTIDGGDLSIPDRFRLADTRVRSGQVNAAIDELELLLSSDQSEVCLRAAYTLGRLYVDYDMTDAATSMFDRAIAADDRYWTPKAELALGDLVRDRDAAGALDHWQRAATSEIRRIADQAQERLAQAAQRAAANRADRSVEPAPAMSESPEAESAAAEPQVIALDAIDDDDVPAESVPQTPATSTPADRALPGDPDPDLEAATTDEDGPIVVVLSALEDQEPGSNSAAFARDDELEHVAPEDTVIDLSDPPVVETPESRPAPSAFASHLGDVDPINPYAALAPDDAVVDVPVAAHNPYAELAPNYDDDAFDPPDGVEPGDWESMLTDWPTEPTKRPSKRSSAFSRYT